MNNQVAENDAMLHQLKNLWMFELEVDLNSNCRDQNQWILCVIYKVLIERPFSSDLFCKIMSKVWHWKDEVLIQPIDNG